jgi:hypothetical protein
VPYQDNNEFGIKRMKKIILIRCFLHLLLSCPQKQHPYCTDRKFLKIQKNLWVTQVAIVDFSGTLA